ncbi:DUF418 domain-containing protein [Gracilibacillus sp. S3-1-1]|uniref:DUF418 domain-containing protein n=1 Tax=Gracilibacillus pellucidus TaxID=3095368 RepID=A0ACC6M3W8_9BACI|nr:DUF418 domain-containing protein [Gracilibacillus sp. S3-1-1]MDX8045622.1 DUF418 domain-containing protein [Gracilibacillus sp. S3-1-1]
MIQTNRISLIDAIRGFSLLGILVANLLIFQYGIYGKDEIALFDVSAFDLAGYHFIKIFIEHSFMPIFAFVFGYSLILMTDKLTERGLPVKRYLFRRFLALIVFGYLHSYFLWEGDILLSYGLIGLFLLVFVKRKAKTILIWFVIFMSLFILLIGIGSIETEEEMEWYDAEAMNSYVTTSIDIYQGGTYQEIKDFRLNEDPLALEDEELLVTLLLMPIVQLPIFLLGIYAAKKEWLQQSKQNKSRYKHAFLWLLPIGLMMKLTPYVTSYVDFTEIGGIVLAIGYIFLFGYLYMMYQDSVLVRAFEQVGKLSLTNYIMQTVVCTFVFYGYGLGLFAQLGIGFAVCFGIVLFSLQVIFSKWYMNHFKQGPLERVMKVFVYLSFKSRPKAKRKDVAA